MTDDNKIDEQLPLNHSLPLALQHVLAMFVSNFTPAIIIASAAGYAFGSGEMIYMIQMAMIFSGVATLMQTIGFWRVGSKLPIMQGTSFAFVPIMITIAKTAGVGAVFASTILAGIFHFILGFFIGNLRQYMPPIVTGLVIVTIGLYLLPVGIQYAAGGVPAMGSPEFGSFDNWLLALSVVVVSGIVKFTTKGVASSAAILIGLVAGYVLGIIMGEVSFAKVGGADWFALPSLYVMQFDWSFELLATAVIGMCLMSIVSAIETVGDISATTKGGVGREATKEEIAGGTFADGLGTALAGVFGGLPNTSFSQNVGLIAMTGVVSRHVVTLSAIILIICGFIPKIGAIISSMPIAVLGGGVIVMFGMVISAGLSMLQEVNMSRRNMYILALSLSLGLGLKTVPSALQHVPDTLQMLLTSGLLPVAGLAILLHIILPKDEA